MSLNLDILNINALMIYKSKLIEKKCVEKLVVDRLLLLLYILLHIFTENRVLREYENMQSSNICYIYVYMIYIDMIARIGSED